MIYGYVRVSTRGQFLNGNSVEEQKESILSRYNNAIIVIESQSSAEHRKLFNNLLDSLESNDLLVITKLDRFCRTVKEGLLIIDQLKEKGVRIHILNMGLIEDSPIGRLIITNLLAYAEFERAIILERTQEGKEIARRSKDYKEGRPKKYSKKQINHALELLKLHSYSQVEEMTGISKSTLTRAKRESKLF